MCYYNNYYFTKCLNLKQPKGFLGLKNIKVIKKNKNCQK